MTRAKRTHYPLHIKIEAIALIRRGQNIASAARTLGIARQRRPYRPWQAGRCLDAARREHAR